MKAPRWIPSLLALSLAACSGLQKKLDADIDDAQSRALKMSSTLNAIAPAASRNDAAVRHEDGAWFGKRAVRLTPANDLPAIFDTPATFDGSVAHLSAFADRISTRSGLPVRVMPDALNAISKLETPGASQRDAKPPVRIVYQNGTFKGLLDVVSAKFGINWRYSGNEIQFHALETRSFNIHTVPGESVLSASVTNNSSSAGGAAAGGGGNSAGGNNKLNIDSQLSVWGNVEKAIASMLSAAGKIASSPATGTITITDVPDVLDRVAKYVESENRSLTKQVVVNVTVLGVTLSDSDTYGINWNSVYTTAFNRFGVKNAFSADVGTPAFSASVLNTSGSKWAGSDILINALSAQGKVRRETALAVMALNNQPVPVLVAQQTTYLAASTTTLASNVGSSTTLTPGTVTTGVNMTILPHVLDNGAIMLQLSAGLSVLRSIVTVSSGGSSIQTPQIDTRNFLQRVLMRSGETLVISGFEQTDGNVDHEGVGHSSNLLMGSHKAKSSKEIFVVIITPALMGSESL